MRIFGPGVYFRASPTGSREHSSSGRGAHDRAVNHGPPETGGADAIGQVLTASLSCFPLLKVGVLLAAISIGSSVLGLRPVRAGRSATANDPKLTSVNSSLHAPALGDREEGAKAGAGQAAPHGRLRPVAGTRHPWRMAGMGDGSLVTTFYTYSQPTPACSPITHPCNRLPPLNPSAGPSVQCAGPLGETARRSSG